MGFEQVDLLAAEGVPPEAVAVGHADTVPVPDFARTLAARGVYVGIDTINSSAPHEVTHRVNVVVDLIRRGHLEQILLSHDVCTLSMLRVNGGIGFGFVLGDFRAALLRAGVTDEEFRTITETNPRRFLA